MYWFWYFVRQHELMALLISDHKHMKDVQFAVISLAVHFLLFFAPLRKDFCVHIFKNVVAIFAWLNMSSNSVQIPKICITYSRFFLLFNV